ncbi:choline-phosphate cytidylyltransferase [Phakopsora pachyrhizi]|uniref:choline-phosphate cytidylyltransferase n=1 Tax=Phakopsora pachyrhizi TaxID=170000 RepID=A0AAV0B835_PHAPC|nr:choline-phosphate cytidylyltransferase [Phakopsora pachyrhizi]CAH7682594.1 choline-phosphate cytidylyltransferase [Phakopsora pachyrhizi]
MLSLPKPPTTIVTPPAPVTKRRRRSGKGQGDSSREASAESNDETATDNDPMADDTDTASMTSPRPTGTQFRHRSNFEDGRPPPAPHHRHKRQASLATTATAAVTSGISMLNSKESGPVPLDGIEKDASLESGIDSGTSTYDGDVSSAPGPASKRGNQKGLAPNIIRQSDCSGDSRKGSIPGSSLSQMSWAPHEAAEQSPISPVSAGLKVISTPKPQPLSKTTTYSNLPPAPHGILSRLAPEELQAKMQDAILNSITQRNYTIRPPPADRPVRIYADGVYDLFHYGHALQLRQCKLFFPQVYLMVGVCSDELVRKYKASPVLNSAERYESVANCKWVDEVIEDAPWQVDASFIEKHKIDYVAHDEEPYQSVDSDDVYAYAKSQGKFLPTRRTDGVSTSELLQRIVGGYVEGVYDNKLEKIGAPELCSSNRAFSDSGSGINRGLGASGGGGYKTPVVNSSSPKAPIDSEMDDGTAIVNEQ